MTARAYAHIFSFVRVGPLTTNNGNADWLRRSDVFGSKHGKWSNPWQRQHSENEEEFVGTRGMNFQYNITLFGGAKDGAQREALHILFD